MVLIFLTALLLALTPLRELIPGYSNNDMVEQTYRNALTIDSLESQLAAQEQMLADIQQVMLERDPAEAHQKKAVKRSDSVKVKPTPYVRTKADSLLRQEIESREK